MRTIPIIYLSECVWVCPLAQPLELQPIICRSVSSVRNTNDYAIMYPGWRFFSTPTRVHYCTFLENTFIILELCVNDQGQTNHEANNNDDSADFHACEGLYDAG